MQHRSAGSHITLINTSERLVVDIPPVGLKPKSLLLFIAAIFDLGFASVVAGPHTFSVEVSPVFWIIALFLWTVALNVSKTALFCLVGHTLIKINLQTFQLQ